MIYFEWIGKAVGVNRRISTKHKGRIKNNPKYNNFKNALSWSMKAEGIEQITKSIYVLLDLYISSKRDIDSLIKPILDCLENSGIIENDRQIKELHVKKTNKPYRSLDKISITIKGLYE